MKKYYTMQEVCDLTGLSYDTLKYYCKEGLIPDVERDQNNHRIFDEDNLGWIKSLICLRQCDMSIKEMKEYLELCLAGDETIPRRQQMLAEKQQELRIRQQKLQESIDFIDYKQGIYSNILAGKIKYRSHLHSSKKALK